MAEVKCKVCGHPFPLTETFCPECGFERHVLPETVSKEVEEYEKGRENAYKSMLLKHTERIDGLQKVRAAMEQRIKDLEQEISVSGYLVLGQYKEAEMSKKQMEYKVLDVYRILKGDNIFGKRPKRSENAHSESILFPCKELQNEHFVITYDDEQVTAKLLSGNWNVRNRTNAVKREILQDRDEIYIGNLIFTFIIPSD